MLFIVDVGFDLIVNLNKVVCGVVIEVKFDKGCGLVVMVFI